MRGVSGLELETLRLMFDPDGSVSANDARWGVLDELIARGLVATVGDWYVECDDDPEEHQDLAITPLGRIVLAASEAK